MNIDQLAFQTDGLAWNATQPSAQSDIWRPIHYLGSKLRIVDAIRNVLDEVEPTGRPVCDLFSGSGTVSRVLSASRTVISVDIQEYSRVLCSAVLNPTTISSTQARELIERACSSRLYDELVGAAEPLTTYEASAINLAQGGDVDALSNVIENGSIIAFQRSLEPLSVAITNPPPLREAAERLKTVQLDSGTGALALRHFGGIYFSYAQAAQFDALLHLAHRSEPNLRDMLLAALVSTASEVVNTVGKQFAQPIRPRDSEGKVKRHLVRQIIRDRSVDIFEVYSKWLDKYRLLETSSRSHRAVRDDYLVALKQYGGQVGIVYADPPYTRDHYSRYYHAIETMCLWDDPDISSANVRAPKSLSRGLYRAERHQSPFCIKSQAPKAFSQLFAAVKQLNVPLVLSYSPHADSSKPRPRVMQVDDLEKLARSYFKSVEVVSPGKVSHNKLNNSRFNSEVAYNAELIFVLR